MKLKGSDVIIYVDEIAKLSKEDTDKLVKTVHSKIHLLHQGDNIYVVSTPFKKHPNEKIFIPKQKPKLEVFILS